MDEAKETTTDLVKEEAEEVLAPGAMPEQVTGLLEEIRQTLRDLVALLKDRPDHGADDDVDDADQTPVRGPWTHRRLGGDA